MKKQPTLRGVQDSPVGEPGDCCQTDNVNHFVLAQTSVASELQLRHSHAHTASTSEVAALALTRESLASDLLSQRDPGPDNPGIFFDSYELTIPGGWQASQPLECETGISESETDQFHNSESEDIYDLYNACNGALRGSLLDISKLDELTAEELEVLNVDKLRDVWRHTASGCNKCAVIIATLNMVRGLAVEEDDETSSD
jgi:hypothetical protein